jgi:hypothetical protein
LDAFLRFSLTTQTEKRFSFQVQNVLLTDLLKTVAVPATKHVSQLAPQEEVVFADVFASSPPEPRYLKREQASGTRIESWLGQFLWRLEANNLDSC